MYAQTSIYCDDEWMLHSRKMIDVEVVDAVPLRELPQCRGTKPWLSTLLRYRLVHHYFLRIDAYLDRRPIEHLRNYYESEWAKIGKYGRARRFVS
jgi:hypothetical protein